MVGARSEDPPPMAPIAPDAGVSVTTGAVLAPVRGAKRAPAAPLTLQTLASGVDDRRVAHFQALVNGGHVPRYQWHFGDGSAAQGWTVLSSVQHAYARPGVYTVTMRVVAEAGELITHRQSVQVP